jgi:hypothetical protein
MNLFNQLTSYLDAHFKGVKLKQPLFFCGFPGLRFDLQDEILIHLVILILMKWLNGWGKYMMLQLVVTTTFERILRKTYRPHFRSK